MLQNLLYGLQVALIGMLVVFAGLVILIGCISVLKLVFYRDGKPKGGKGVETAEPPVQQAANPTAVEISKTPENQGLIAVITAAVAAMLQGGPEGTPGGFQVRSIRRVKNAPAWNRAGREEQIYSRF